jgi:hypothetical protein
MHEDPPPRIRLPSWPQGASVKRFVAVSLVAVGCFLGRAGAWAGDFAIDLQARVGKASRTAHAETIGLGSRDKERGVLEVKAGDRVTIRWTLKREAPKDTVKDVTVHLFVVKEEKLGQRPVPKLDRDVVAETAMIMDFKPRDKAHGELTITIEKPGSYLLRLETIGVAKGIEGHEYFAALDLDVR